MVEKKKSKPSMEQAMGIRLTERQFKATLISNLCIGYLGTVSSFSKEDVLARIPEFIEISECILGDCVLDPLMDDA